MCRLKYDLAECVAEINVHRVDKSHSVFNSFTTAEDKGVHKKNEHDGWSLQEERPRQVEVVNAS